MKISQILNELQCERDVIIEGACISTELVKYLGDIPVYRFRISIVRQVGEYHGVEVLHANTVKELVEIIYNDDAFSVCPICGEVIEGLRYQDIENGFEFCSDECFSQHLKNKAECECCDKCGGCPEHCTCEEDEDYEFDKDFGELTPEDLENLGGFTGSDFIPEELENGFDDPLETDEGESSDEFEVGDYEEPGDAETCSEE